MSDRFLSVVEVAEQLGIRRHGVLALIRSGELTAADVSAKSSQRPLWRISEVDLAGFIARRTHQTATPRRRKRKTQAKQFF